MSYKGKVTDFQNEQIHLFAYLKYYLCRGVEIVVDTHEILISREIPFQNIQLEIYSYFYNDNKACPDWHDTRGDNESL